MEQQREITDKKEEQDIYATEIHRLQEVLQVEREKRERLEEENQSLRQEKELLKQQQEAKSGTSL